MKKIICVLISVIMILTLTSCGSGKTGTNTETNNNDVVTPVNEENTDIDVDLTVLSSTMVYSEVANIMNSPDEYIGKIIKMNGQFALYQAVDENGEAIPDQIYFACVIADATACCQQGIEFVLAGDYTYPDDYPELESEITVVGEFQSYMEEENQYFHLVNAEFVD